MHGQFVRAVYEPGEGGERDHESADAPPCQGEQEAEQGGQAWIRDENAHLVPEMLDDGGDVQCRGVEHRKVRDQRTCEQERQLGPAENHAINALLLV